jgi:hypothetical protein
MQLFVVIQKMFIFNVTRAKLQNSGTKILLLGLERKVFAFNGDLQH